MNFSCISGFMVTRDVLKVLELQNFQNTARAHKTRNALAFIPYLLPRFLYIGHLFFVRNK